MRDQVVSRFFKFLNIKKAFCLLSYISLVFSVIYFFSFLFSLFVDYITL